MPDLAMCKNYKCPSRKSCYRYTAIPYEYWQTYAVFTVNEGEDKCENYIEDFTKNNSSRNVKSKK